MDNNPQKGTNPITIRFASNVPSGIYTLITEDENNKYTEWTFDTDQMRGDSYTFNSTSQSTKIEKIRYGKFEEKRESCSFTTKK